MQATHDPDRYRKCMEELKHRVAILDSAMAPFRKQQELAVPNLELAALQLRKAYELIGLATISANRKSYSDIRSKFEKDWNLAEILNVIEKFNPKFLPVGVMQSENSVSDTVRYEIKENGRFLKKRDLLSYHGKIGSLMHAKNPYAPEIRFREWHEWICERRDELVLLLSNHVANVEYQKTFYLCSMQDAQDGSVSTTVFQLTDQK